MAEGLTWGNAIAGGIDRGVDMYMQNRRMNLAEKREGREEELYQKAKLRQEQMVKALDQLSDTKLDEKTRLTRPEGVDSDVWIEARAATLSADEKTRKAATEKSIDARNKLLSAYESSGQDLDTGAKVVDEIMGDGLITQATVDPQTGAVQIYRGSKDNRGNFVPQGNKPFGAFKNKDELTQALYKAVDPKNILPLFLKRHLEAEEKDAAAKREVKTHEEKKKIDQGYTAPRIFQSREKITDASGERETTEHMIFDPKTRKMKRVPVEGEEGDGDATEREADDLVRRALGKR